MATGRIFTSYLTFTLTPEAWALTPERRRTLLTQALANLEGCGRATGWYQVFPARAEYDFLLWATVDAEAPEAPDRHFADVARRLAPWRRYLATPLTLCGLTKPSVYVRAHENPQEINPYDNDRKPYFVIYPFAKTVEWYLKPREERQVLMTEHIRLGKQFPSVKQLLLYSFGIQDQEFIVSYEMDDLAIFSDLVQALRSTSARAFTLLDTPIITGVRRTPAALIEILAG